MEILTAGIKNNDIKNVVKAFKNLGTHPKLTEHLSKDVSDEAKKRGYSCDLHLVLKKIERYFYCEQNIKSKELLEVLEGFCNNWLQSHCYCYNYSYEVVTVNGKPVGLVICIDFH